MNTNPKKLYANLCEKEKGFTLVETLVTILVVATALLSSLIASTAIQRTAESIHDRAVAIQDANQVVEQMRNTALTGTFPGNVTAAFPDGAEVAGFDDLTYEVVTVDFVDSNANPLDVTVTVAWTDNTNRAVTQTLRTLVTQRT